jgi:hypothetical protein
VGPRIAYDADVRIINLINPKKLRLVVSPSPDGYCHVLL